MRRTLAMVLAYIFRGVVGIGALVVAVIVVSALQRTAPTVETVEGGVADRTVVVFDATRVPVSRQWLGYGTAVALDEADVPSRVAATVLNVGDDVLAGRVVQAEQILVELDPSDFTAQLAAAQGALDAIAAELQQLPIERVRLTERLELAQADAEIAIRERDRVERLRANSAGSLQDLEAVRRAYNAAATQVAALTEQIEQLPNREAALLAQQSAREAERDLAQLRKDRAVISSPLEGVLSDVEVEIGEDLREGRVVAHVVDLRTIEVPLRLPATARAEVRPGDPIELFSTSNEQTWQATVDRVAPVDNADQRTVTVFALVEQPDAHTAYAAGDTGGLLTPGMYVGGRVTVREGDERFVVPRRSLRSGRLLVVGETEDRQYLRAVTVETSFSLEGPQAVGGLPDDQWAVLTEDSPLTPGLPIVLNATATLQEGEGVQPQRYEATASVEADE